MANPTLSSYGPSPGLLNKYAERKALLTLLPNLELYQWGREAIVPGGQGSEVHAPYFFDKTLAAVSTAEGASLTNSSMSAGSYSSTLLEYTKSFSFTRFLWATKSIPLIAETTKQLTMSMAKAWEGVIQGVISGGAAMSANSWVSPDNSTVYGSILETTNLKPTALSVARTKLASNYVPGFDSLGGEYAGVFHPNATHDMRTNLSGGATLTLERSSMNVTGPFRSTQVGTLFNIRVHESAWSAKAIMATNGMSAAGTSGESGYLNYIIGPEAYFVSPLSVSRPEVIFHGFGTGGTSDPGNRLATEAVYSVFTAFAGPRATRMVHLPVGKTL